MRTFRLAPLGLQHTCAREHACETRVSLFFFFMCFNVANRVFFVCAYVLDVLGVLEKLFVPLRSLWLTDEQVALVSGSVLAFLTVRCGLEVQNKPGASSSIAALIYAVT